MASITKDLKTFAMLMILLFVIAVVVAVTYIGSGFLKSAACTIEDSTYVWEGEQCLNASGGTAQTVTSITKITTVEATIDIALALLTLVVVIAVFALVIRSARSFEGMGKP